MSHLHYDFTLMDDSGTPLTTTDPYDLYLMDMSIMGKPKESKMLFRQTTKVQLGVSFASISSGPQYAFKKVMGGSSTYSSIFSITSPPSSTDDVDIKDTIKAQEQDKSVSSTTTIKTTKTGSTPTETASETFTEPTTSTTKKLMTSTACTAVILVNLFI